MAGVIVIILTSFFKMTDTVHQPVLHYLVREPKVKSEKAPLVILLHGVGSNEQHMFSFADALPDRFKVVAARGPLTLGNGSYAWFHVEFGANGPVPNEVEAERARITIVRFIAELKQVEDFDENQVYLLGFSQGGIMSYNVALTNPEKVAGIAVMSGRLMPEIKPLVVADERLKQLQIFVSHGKQDNVLKFAYAEEAVAYLKSKGIQPGFHIYDEGHTISGQMLADAVAWLNQQI